MSNAQTNQAFLTATDAGTRGEVLGAIAGHYGISQGQALEEIVGKDAEHLLDYLTGPTRAAVSVLMQRHHLSTQQAKGAL